jgi:hypothetical protein
MVISKFYIIRSCNHTTGHSKSFENRWIQISDIRYNDRVRVYRPPNSRFDESYTQKVVVNGRFSVNV